MPRSLLQPAYEAIGPASCLGMQSGWAGYSWPPAIAMASGMMVFLMDFAAERAYEYKYAESPDIVDTETAVAGSGKQCQELHGHGKPLTFLQAPQSATALAMQLMMRAQMARERAGRRSLSTAIIVGRSQHSPSSSSASSSTVSLSVFHLAVPETTSTSCTRF